MSIEIVQVDAFTDTPFRGNPAAVCLLERAADERWMQRVAAEMALSETAFLVPAEGSDDGDPIFNLRWFTPTVEVDLCGHATLAAAHVLWQDGHLPPGSQARFQTLSGRLTASRQADGWIALDFPAEPPEEVTSPPGLLSALGVQAWWVGRNRFDFLVEVADAEAVRRAAPDCGKLRRRVARGVIVTSVSSDPRYDFVSRFFAPAAGIDEDPVTGSAHCALGPYWSKRLEKKRLVGYQASRRGGVVEVELRDKRVQLRGQAVTVLRAQLLAVAAPGGLD